MTALINASSNEARAALVEGRVPVGGTDPDALPAASSTDFRLRELEKEMGGLRGDVRLLIHALGARGAGAAIPIAPSEVTVFTPNN